MPDISGMTVSITPSRYLDLRSGADYEYLTPGWRSEEVSWLLFLQAYGQCKYQLTLLDYSVLPLA